jgi:hypothetical protein
MTFAGTFGGLACGYNSGVVAPVMLYMDEVYPGIKAISKVINATMREAEPEDYTNFYELLRSLAINKLSTGNKSKK